MHILDPCRHLPSARSQQGRSKPPCNNCRILALTQLCGGLPPQCNKGLGAPCVLNVKAPVDNATQGIRIDAYPDNWVGIPDIGQGGKGCQGNVGHQSLIPGGIYESGVVSTPRGWAHSGTGCCSRWPFIATMSSLFALLLSPGPTAAILQMAIPLAAASAWKKVERLPSAPQWHPHNTPARQLVASQVVEVSALHSLALAQVDVLSLPWFLPSIIAGTVDYQRHPRNNQERYPHAGIVPCPEAICLEKQPVEGRSFPPPCRHRQRHGRTPALPRPWRGFLKISPFANNFDEGLVQITL